ncbi:hypothetical protein EVAR_29688_1 [Eumeta japonica]|uniref:Uncharacterized protein n=1 Tax=Eumeta variegata TaxID=151549 RepID=A0A4C1W0U6_EUMVA|nr:hypothetical protein EVAR_29688_1 [Eumeta japonica]
MASATTNFNYGYALFVQDLLPGWATQRRHALRARTGPCDATENGMTSERSSSRNPIESFQRSVCPNTEKTHIATEIFYYKTISLPGSVRDFSPEPELILTLS